MWKSTLIYLSRSIWATPLTCSTRSPEMISDRLYPLFQDFTGLFFACGKQLLFDILCKNVWHKHQNDELCMVAPPSNTFLSGHVDRLLSVLFNTFILQWFQSLFKSHLFHTVRISSLGNLRFGKMLQFRLYSCP